MYKKFFKRFFDILFSLILIIVLSPVYLIISIFVLIFMGWPVLFKQPRPGKDEKIFNMYKFRTMTNKKDKDGNLLPDEERLPKFGKLLRKTSLDELPELFNILTGKMSFIGPRPLLVEYLPYYTEEEKHRHDIRPGLTGWAQVNGRNNLNWDARFKKDLEYINNISLKFDLKIIFLTIKKVLFKEDIQMGKELKFDRLDIERRNNNNIKKINYSDYKSLKKDIYKCLLELKNNDEIECKKILNNISKFLKDDSAIIYVFIENKKVVGFIWGYYLDINSIHINYFVILSDYRNKGIGSKLLKQFIKDYNNVKFELLVNINNLKAQNFYKRNGFTLCKYNEDKYKMILG